MGITKTAGFSTETNRMAEIIKAIGHPARLAIIQHIVNSPACICGDIVDELPLAQSTISRHLAELRNAGIIKGNITGNSVCYCINEVTLTEVAALFKTFSTTTSLQNKCC